MPLSLTVTDLQDGSGATSSIAGSDAGSTNTVYVQRDGSWTSSGTRTGDGNVTLSLPEGAYFAYAHGTLIGGSPGISTVTPVFNVTSSTGNESMHERCMDAIKETFQELIAAGSLPDFPGVSNVSVMLHLDEKNVTFPHIFIVPTEAETIETGRNQSGGNDDWHRPILVALVLREHEDAADTTVLLWRERLMKALRQKKLSGMTENIVLNVRPGNIVDFVASQYQYLVSSFVVSPWTREARG